MTDEFEDRLRNHLAGQASQVRVDPDPSAFIDRSAGRTWRRGRVAGCVAALTVVVAGAGVLTGVNLSGATSAAPTPASTPTTGSDRAGAALAPAASGGQVPSIVVASPYTFLFSRVTSSGVTVRAYSAGTTTTGGCGPAVTCVPSTTVPTVPTVPSVPTCPAGAECAQPIVVPHTTGTASGSGTTSGAGGASGGVATPVSPPDQPPVSVPTTSGPPSTTTGCGPLVVELSTDRAVGTGSVSLPSSTPSANTVEVLGTGSFGTAEGAPVGWVAVWVGSGVASVQLTAGGAAVDSMAPDGGVVVLAASGDAGLVDATVVGLGPTGATVDSVPVGQAATPDVASGCPAPTSTPPVSTTTTVPPPVPVPTSTTTTTVTGGPVPVPTDRPVTTAGG
jgi:hypothetical protein